MGDALAGREALRCWVAERLAQTSLRLYLFCLLAQTSLVAGIGATLMYSSRLHLVPFAVGMGIITYALAVTVYTLPSVWRMRRTMT